VSRGLAVSAIFEIGVGVLGNRVMST
jgi:hypothetical protein